MSTNAPSVEQKTEIVAVGLTDFATKVSQSLVSHESKSGSIRMVPMTRKAFAETAAAANLKGQALKRAHWTYIQACTNELNGIIAQSIASGKSKVVGFTQNAKGTAGTVRLETAEHFSRHEVEPAKVEMTQDDALAMIAKARGITVETLKETLKAALELAAAK